MAAFTVLSLGWGVQSFTLAAMMALEAIPRADFLIHADTTHERRGTYDFAERWAPWLGEHGLTVVTVTGKRTDVVVSEWSNSVVIPAFTSDRKTGSAGQTKRQCTHDWKIAPIRQFIREEMKRRDLPLSTGIIESWQGISLDEWQRMRSSDVDYIKNVYPLVERRITRATCTAWLQDHGLEVPPKSACTFCPFRSIASWQQLKRDGGDDWQEAELVDATIRDKRPKAELFVHPHRKPLAEAIHIPEDEGSRQLELALELEKPCDSGYCFV